MLRTGGRSGTRTVVPYTAFFPVLKRASTCLPTCTEVLMRPTSANQKAPLRGNVSKIRIREKESSIRKDTRLFFATNAKGYNLLHLNAIYDLCSKLFIDVLLQPCKRLNEHLALTTILYPGHTYLWFLFPMSQRYSIRR